MGGSISCARAHACDDLRCRDHRLASTMSSRTSSGAPGARVQKPSG